MDIPHFYADESLFVEKPIATVLVVDDTPDNLTLMGTLLRDHYHVKVANQGEKALRIAQSSPPPDLILLDIMMPGIDGYEVCRHQGTPAVARHSHHLPHRALHVRR